MRALPRVRQRVLRRIIFGAGLSLTLPPARARTQPGPPPTLVPAVVQSKQLLVTFPLPYYRVKVPDPPVVGHYIWRIKVEAAANFSIVLAADTAMRTTDVRDIIRASTLRRCDDPDVSSALRCTGMVKGKAMVQDNAVVMQVDDSAIVALVRQSRPVKYWRYMFEPGGRFRVDNLTFVYNDNPQE